MTERLLFSGTELREKLASRRRAANNAVQRLDPDILLATPTEDLVASFLDEFKVSPLRLHHDRMVQLEVEETQVNVTPNRRDDGLLFHSRGPFDGGPTRYGSITRPRLVPAAMVSVAIPFDGDPALFEMKASTFMDPSELTGRIEGNELVLTYTAIDPTVERVNDFVDDTLRLISKNIEWVNHDIATFSAQLPGLARGMVEARKARLRRDRGLEGALGVPIRRRADAPARPVPVVRKRLGVRRVRHQAAPAQPYQDEHALEQADYEEIIEVIQAMGRAFERAPATFAKADLGEEDLRNLILLFLNGTFQGHAGGELFNGDGRTDLLVRIADRNVFIGECKFWDGTRELEKAIDQLLGYLVWRDTKAALVLFITRQDATAVIDKADKADAAIRAHANYKRPGPASRDPQLRRDHVLHHTGDPNREIHLALLPVVIRKPKTNGQV